MLKTSDMSGTALNWMHADFNKRHKVSRCLSRRLHYRVWREIRTMKVIRCPPSSSPQGDINSNRNPNLKDKPNTNANPKVITSWFMLRLTGHFVTFIKVEHASDYVSEKIREINVNVCVVSLCLCVLFDVQVRFDKGSRVYIAPNAKYKGKDELAGICGNFNGRNRDDLMMPDKNTDAADDTKFAYAWRDEEDCPSAVSLDPCLENPDRHGWAEKGTKACSNLQSTLPSSFTSPFYPYLSKIFC